MGRQPLFARQPTPKESAILVRTLNKGNRSVPNPADREAYRRLASEFSDEMLEKYRADTPLSSEDRDYIRYLERDQLLSAIYHARRLLQTTGKPVTENAVIKIVEASGIKTGIKTIKDTLQEHLTRQTEAASKEREARKNFEYETPDGMLLTLTQNKDGQLEARLEEGRITPDSRNQISYLQKIIEIFADVNEKRTSFVPAPENGGAEKKVVTLAITGVKPLTPIEQEALAEKLLYYNMRRMLEQRTKEIEQEKRPFTQTTLDCIEFWTKLTIGDLCYRKRGYRASRGIYTPQEKQAAEKKLLEVADFLRELYELIEIDTGVTKEDICSNKKPRKTARARHIMMYVTRKKFQFLSSTDVGLIFSEQGATPKNHATVLITEKNDFDESIGLKPESYIKEKDTKRLYKDAREKYEARHKN